MTSLSSSSYIVDDDAKWFNALADDLYPIKHSSSTSATRDLFIPSVSDNLKENMRALELRMARLEDKFGKALKEHEETVEMLLKVIKDAT